jgi:hypothetical protein
MTINEVVEKTLGELMLQNISLRVQLAELMEKTADKADTPDSKA